MSIVVNCCGQTAGWIKMPLGTEVGLGLGDIVLDGDRASPTESSTASPTTFQPVSVVAKRSPISATAELLLKVLDVKVLHWGPTAEPRRVWGGAHSRKLKHFLPDTLNFKANCKEIRKNEEKLECGPMPNVMAALPNIGGALCSTPQSLADANYYSAMQ